MATFTCWCGCVIRENSHPQNAGHIVWDSTEGFYDSVAEAIQGFYDAKESGNSSGWLKDFFGQQYPTDASSREVISDIILTQSQRICSGIYRCPECKRVHIHVVGSENRWESFVPENRASGDK